MRPHSTPHDRPRRVCLLERESNLGIAVEAIATQDHALRGEVERRGDRVVAVCVDDGYSGALPPLERPAICKMLSLADAGEIDYVLGTELARANRGDAFNYYFIRHELAPAGVALEFLDQTYHHDGESEAGALIEGIQVLLPSIERRAISRRFARGKKRVADEGFSYTGRRPFGLEYTKGGQEKHRWSKRADEVPHVQRIFELAASGLSREAIARLFNEEGVPSSRGGKWWGSTIAGIITNPRYKGEFPIGRYQSVRAHRPYRPIASRPSAGKAGIARRRVRTGHRVRPAGEWANCVYKPECQIVSAELWERANAMARVTAATSPRSSKEPRLLKGLVYHEAPHGPLPRHLMHAHAGKKRRARYACTHRAGSGGKVCWYAVRAEPLEEAVWARVRDLALEPERLLDDFVASCKDLVTQGRRRHAQLEEARALMQKYQLTLTNLTVAHYSGDLARDEYLRAKEATEHLLREAQAACQKAQGEAGALADGPSAALADAILARTAHLTGSRTRATADSIDEEIQEAIREAVRATLGSPTAQELDALDLEGRRQRVRQVVERVEVGSFGARLRLRLGGRLEPIANAITPACPAGRRRAGGGAAGRSGVGRAPVPWRSSGRC
jgi:DNA invertase Pin-like site-specific DNA recombinase